MLTRSWFEILSSKRPESGSEEMADIEAHATESWRTCAVGEAHPEFGQRNAQLTTHERGLYVLGVRFGEEIEAAASDDDAMADAAWERAGKLYQRIAEYKL